MDVISQKIILFIVLFFGFNAFSSTMEVCLESAKKRTHVLDQHIAIEDCFQANLDRLSAQQCFSYAKQLNKNKKFYDLSETLNTLCFYSTSTFNDVKSCIAGSRNFAIADNHDEAVFDCYKQFQNTLSQKQCIELSRQLIYPAKKDYLFQHCQSNP